jgi:ankyrin repeat protein
MLASLHLGDPCTLVHKLTYLKADDLHAHIYYNACNDSDIYRILASRSDVSTIWPLIFHAVKFKTQKEVLEKKINEDEIENMVFEEEEEIIVDLKYLLNKQDNTFLYTPGHLAVLHNNLAYLQILLDTGINAELKDINGMRIIDLAYSMNRAEMIELLKNAVYAKVDRYGLDIDDNKLKTDQIRFMFNAVNNGNRTTSLANIDRFSKLRKHRAFN